MLFCLTSLQSAPPRKSRSSWSVGPSTQSVWYASPLKVIVVQPVRHRAARPFALALRDRAGDRLAATLDDDHRLVARKLFDCRDVIGLADVAGTCYHAEREQREHRDDEEPRCQL